jgi:hypothetical protein
MLAVDRRGNGLEGVAPEHTSTAMSGCALPSRPGFTRSRSSGAPLKASDFFTNFTRFGPPAGDMSISDNDLLLGMGSACTRGFGNRTGAPAHVETASPTEGGKMNNKINRALHPSRLQALLAGAVLVVGMGLGAATASATTITATVGGVPAGADIYENFDSSPLGTGTFTTPTGIVVSFAGGGQSVTGSVSGEYAAPYLSGGNGVNFGSQPDGADATTYLATGGSGSSVTLALAGPTRYMGLLWGSVDSYNTLTFYNGATMVGQFKGADVTSLANGDQGENGTFYVNINLSDSFTRVVAESSSKAFEFDNVAFSTNPLRVPEPGTVGVFLLGLLLAGSAYRMKGRRQV